MKLPAEILNIIAAHGLNNFRDSIAWSQISSYFRTRVENEIGVIVVEDGRAFDAREKPQDDSLNFHALLQDKNYALVSTDSAFADDSIGQVSRLCAAFLNICIVIESVRSYSDDLAKLVDKIARRCQNGTKINIIYRNSTNFLSNLYFREFTLLNEKDLKLLELHVVGNKMPTKFEMCGVDTLFQHTYVYNISTIHSLNIQDANHFLIAPDLKAIKRLSMKDDDINLLQYFRECPKLRHIESTSFPLHCSSPIKYYPKCSDIVLDEFRSGVEYPWIEGSRISRSLTLKPAMRSMDLDFRHMSFPLIKSLHIGYRDSSIHHVTFSECDFHNLRLCDCHNCIIPWECLISSNSQIKDISLSLISEVQVKWLAQSPYQLSSITFVSPYYPISDFIRINSMESSTLYSNRIKLELSSLWECYILQKLVLNERSVSNLLDLEVTVKEKSIASDMNRSRRSLEMMGIKEVAGCIFFDIPTLREFKITEREPSVSTSSDIKIMSGNVRSSSFTSSNIQERVTSSSFSFEGTSNFGELRNLPISPSTFRRNSLAGNNADIAKRLESVGSPDDEIPYERFRRKSSIGSPSFHPITGIFAEEVLDLEDDVVVFSFSSELPKIFTANLEALRSSYLTFAEVPSKFLSVLRVIVQANDNWISINGPDDGLAFCITTEIISAISFPFDLHLSGIQIERLQIMVDLKQLDLECFNKSQAKLADEIQSYLGYKGYKLPVSINEIQGVTSRVSVLLLFEED